MSYPILQAYITCPLGKQWVGYVAICYGVANAFSSALALPSLVNLLNSLAEFQSWF